MAARNKLVNWSLGEVTDLLEHVEPITALYDTTHYRHKDRAYINDQYQKIADKFEDEKKTWKICKAKVRACRNSISSYLREKKRTTGGRKVARPPWYDRAKFFEPHIKTLEPTENMSTDIVEDFDLGTQNSIDVNAPNVSASTSTVEVEEPPPKPSSASTSTTEFVQQQPAVKHRSHSKSKKGEKCSNETTSDEALFGKLFSALSGSTQVDPIAMAMSDRMSMLTPGQKYKELQHFLARMDTLYPLVEEEVDYETVFVDEENISRTS